MDVSEIVATYGAAWNELEQAKRTALLEASWADDGVYQDPSGIAKGRAALVAYIGEFHEGNPGHTVEQASGVDAYDAGLRWAWVTRNGDQIALEGMDFAELAPDGRIKRIVGFFGPLPPLPFEV
jgi:SnoaL-like protein